MRKVNAGNGSCLFGVVLTVIGVVLCVAITAVVLPAPGVASAHVSGGVSPRIESMARSAQGVPPAGKQCPLRMRIPDEPAVSGDVDLPQVPKK